MSNIRRGFTMVELLIVIAIIGILTTIGFMSFGKYQSDARDSERSSKATIISEYLEKYYSENGEYPSCSKLTVAPNIVKTTTLPGIDTSVLTTPQKPAGVDNSINCTDLTSMSQTDYFAYIGDGSTTCVSGTSCLEYTIKYKDESTNSIATLLSRHRTDIATSGNIGNLSASATGFTSINLTWQSIDNASSYTLQRASDINFSTNLVSSTVSGLNTSVTGLSYNTKYYFRVQPVATSSTGNWSNTTNTTTWNLTTPVGVATTNSTTQITESWGAIAHAASYSIQGDDNAGFSSPTPYSGVTSLSQAFASLTPGKTHYFRVQAINGPYASSWSTTNTATTTISAPSCSATTNSTTQITVACGAISGATAYNYQVDDNTGFTSAAQYSSASTSYAVTGLTPGKTWYFRVQTVGANTTSGWSGTSNATTTISAPSCSATTNSTTQITEACGAVPGAVTYTYYVDDNSAFSSPAGYNSASASYAFTGLTPGKTWYFKAYALGANANSGWSGTSTATTTISAPSVGATANSLSQITASWGTVSGATVYYVQIANNSSFTSPSTYGTGSTSYVFTGLSPGTTYYFRAYTQGVNTNSGWSGTAAATTQSPTLSGPLSCGGSYNLRPTFTLYLTLNEVSYDIAGNSSTVTWQAWRSSSSTGTFNQYNGNTHNVVVNGTSVKNGASRTNRFRYYSGGDEAMYVTSTANTNSTDTGAINVAHNADGTKTISGSISDNFTNGSGGAGVPGAASCSFNYTLSKLR